MWSWGRHPLQHHLAQYCYVCTNKVVIFNFILLTVGFKMDRLKKKSKNSSQTDWTHSGSFINKPSRGWLHPDEQLRVDAGVSYGVRVSLLELFSVCLVSTV